MKIIVVGAGVFGTALTNSLSYNKENDTIIFSRDKHVAKTINSLKSNTKYFPHIKLNERIIADYDINVLRNANIIFLAIPSNSVIQFVRENIDYIDSRSLIINLAKGFGENGVTLIESLEKYLPDNKMLTMKGPTFAEELIRGFPSAFTIGSKNTEYFNIIKKITQNTNIRLDFSEDIIGVEILSILKNIYAIALGIIDAQFNSANTRFFVLTKAFHEIKKILQIFGGNENTLYKYCGIGDFGLTALNDLSRNRTLGLMIGKGFLRDTKNQSTVVIEGVRSIKIVHDKLSIKNKKDFPIIIMLHKLLEENLSVKEFINYVLLENNI